jgi:hypothetical protein
MFGKKKEIKKEEEKKQESKEDYSQFKVEGAPSTETTIAASNLVYFNTDDYKTIGKPKFLEIKGFVYRTGEDSRTNKNCIGINRLQRSKFKLII